MLLREILSIVTGGLGGEVKYDSHSTGRSPRATVEEPVGIGQDPRCMR